MEWSARAPDMNPIEQVWNTIKVKLNKRMIIRYLINAE